jgi:hypothetical protein
VRRLFARGVVDDGRKLVGRRNRTTSRTAPDGITTPNLLLEIFENVPDPIQIRSVDYHCDNESHNVDTVRAFKPGRGQMIPCV